MHQICLLCTDSDNVILQQETETTHVSKLQLLFNSQLVDPGFLVEHLTSGVEHPAEIQADARDLDVDALEVLPLPHSANFVTGFPVRRLRHYPPHPTTQLDEKYKVALLDFREHPFFAAFPL